jgi:hypothetical protein
VSRLPFIHRLRIITEIPSKRKKFHFPHPAEARLCEAISKYSLTFTYRLMYMWREHFRRFGRIGCGKGWIETF